MISTILNRLSTKYEITQINNNDIHNKKYKLVDNKNGGYVEMNIENYKNYFIDLDIFKNTERISKSLYFEYNQVDIAEQITKTIDLVFNPINEVLVTNPKTSYVKNNSTTISKKENSNNDKSKTIIL